MISPWVSVRCPLDCIAQLFGYRASIFVTSRLVVVLLFYLLVILLFDVRSFCAPFFFISCVFEVFGPVGMSTYMLLSEKEANEVFSRTRRNDRAYIYDTHGHNIYPLYQCRLCPGSYGFGPAGGDEVTPECLTSHFSS